MKSSEIVINQTEGRRWLSFPPLQAYPSVIHGFLLGDRDSPPDKAGETVEQILKRITSGGRKLITLSQMHRDGCAIISRKDRPGSGYQADAVFTDRDDVLISVQVADCLSIFLVNQTSNVVGLIHAGWRGTILGIVQTALSKAERQLGCRAGDFTAVLGPCIRSCCYQVSGAVAVLFDRECVQKTKEGSTRLDLVRANVKQLADYGVEQERIFVCRECTCCRADLFFSHRREGKAAGRMIGFMGLK